MEKYISTKGITIEKSQSVTDELIKINIIRQLPSDELKFK